MTSPDLSAAAAVLASAESTLRGPDPRVGWAVVSDGEVVASGRAQECFRIASMTKSFTAAAVLRALADSPEHSLETPLGALIPELAAPLSAATIRQALTMTTGSMTDDPWADRLESLSAAEFSALIAEPATLIQAPGTGYRYSNLGYALLGRAVTALTGEDFTAYTAREVIAAAGLTSTGFDVADFAGRIAPGYRIDAPAAAADQTAPSASGAERSADGEPASAVEPAAPRAVVEELTGPGAFSAIGGIVSTAEDIAAWLRVLAASPELWRSGQPIDVRARGERTELDTYCFGLHRTDDSAIGTTVWHSGGYPGYGSHMRVHPETGFGVVVFGNETYFPARTWAIAAVEAAFGHGEAPAPGEAATLPDSRVLITVGADSLEPSSAEAEETIRRAALLAVDFDDAVADEVFSPNMDLDVPRELRRDQLARTAGGEVRTVTMTTALTAKAEVAAADGSVSSLYISLHPYGRVQVMRWL